MELRDGFIVGISSYCDRWCEACAWTSRCRLFADVARIEGSLDSPPETVAEASALSEDVPPAPPRWMQAFLAELNEAAADPASGEESRHGPEPALQHESILARADGYLGQVHAWLRVRDYFAASDPSDPRAVVGWFHTLIPAKIFRALTGLRRDLRDAHEGVAADCDGSAKVALLGIERSHLAWLQLVEHGLATRPEAEPFIADLVWLGEQLENVFPNARGFVRPAFDEPAAVAKMRAAGGA
jgi:hypothetical protein